MNTELRQELLAMIGEDAEVREELAADGSLFEGYHPRMEELHRKNAASLRAIMEIYGWPGIDLVGEDGEEAAWRIAQHSISEPEFMRSVLRRLRSAAEEGRAPLWQVAMMEDRIRMFEGRLQLYGTSFDWNENGLMAPYPSIEKEEEVDERRAAMGLPPLQESIARQPDSREKLPENLAERRRKMNEWARKKGWR